MLGEFNDESPDELLDNGNDIPNAAFIHHDKEMHKKGGRGKENFHFFLVLGMIM